MPITRDVIRHGSVGVAVGYEGDELDELRVRYRDVSFVSKAGLISTSDIPRAAKYFWIAGKVAPGSLATLKQNIRAAGNVRRPPETIPVEEQYRTLAELKGALEKLFPKRTVDENRDDRKIIPSSAPSAVTVSPLPPAEQRTATLEELETRITKLEASFSGIETEVLTVLEEQTGRAEQALKEIKAVLLALGEIKNKLLAIGQAALGE